MADDHTPPEPDATSDPDHADEAPAELGDPGKAALSAERKARAAAEREAKALKARLDELETANLSEVDRAIKEARDAATRDAMSAVNDRILRAEVKAMAGGKLADPSDAVNLIDLSQFPVDDDGNVDTKAIASAIDELVKAKPYLAPAGARPAPLPGGGARPTPAGNPIDDALRRRR